MRVQLWSSNFEPEPTGIGPVSALLTRLLTERGWEVDVIAAHPHYPEPAWGKRARPYRERRAGARVVRLPLLVGRATAGRRLLQEATFAGALGLTAPALPSLLARPDVLLVASPAFGGLLPAIAYSRLRGIPMVLWLHDILPDGATAAGVLEPGGPVLELSRRLERAAYRRASRIVVLSAPFRGNLLAKGVPAEKIELIYDPATRGLPALDRRSAQDDHRPRVIAMGNIGRTQGLAPLVRAFERDERMERLGVRLVITGTGVAADEVAAEIRSERVEMPGLVSDQRLESELHAATLALVSQSYEGTEFNLPSKLMNFMAYGLPIVAAVNPATEVARLVREAEAGWIADSSEPAAFPEAVARALESPDQARARGAAARRFAERHFSPEGFGRGFDSLLRGAAEAHGHQSAVRSGRRARPEPALRPDARDSSNTRSSRHRHRG